MNIERAVEEFDGDREFLIEVMERFLEKVRSQLGIMQQAISNGEVEVVTREVHSMMVTDQSDRDHVTTSIMAECDGYIMKPFDKEMIVQQLGRVGLKESTGVKKRKWLIPDFSKVGVTLYGSR